MKFSERLKSAVLLDNPVFMQTIGLCPALATTTSLSNAIGMGAAATVVLICSNIVISLLRKFIPEKVRIAAFITIIAGFVTIIDLSLQAFVPSLAASLGLFLPLIVVNCIILGRAEAYASKNKVLPSALDVCAWASALPSHWFSWASPVSCWALVPSCPVMSAPTSSASRFRVFMIIRFP